MSASNIPNRSSNLTLILSVQEGQLAKYVVLQATSYKLLQSSYFLDEGCHSGHLGGTLPGPISPDSTYVGETGFHIHHLDDRELGANQEVFVKVFKFE